MKIALYARVSRDDLHCENQKKILDEWVQRNNITEFEYFKEEQSTRKTRPVKEEVLKRFRSGEFHGIIVTRIDRFARSLQELVMDIEGIINQGGRFVAIMNGFDFEKKSYNASQQLMLNIFASFSQFEREIIRERTLEGLARTKSQGKIGGRHPVNCGCGLKLPNGSVHNGNVKPIRNESNVIIGWTNQEDARIRKRARERAKEKDMNEKCEICGRYDIKLERHHPDYSKPMHFKTLCLDCHRNKHKNQTPPVAPSDFTAQ